MVYISIHVLREEDDGSKSSISHSIFTISIHVLREEDDDIEIAVFGTGTISIHVLREEDDGVNLG